MLSALRQSILLEMAKTQEEFPALNPVGRTISTGQSEVTGTVMNLITIMIGAGVLSYPRLFSRVGIPLGVAMNIFCCLLSMHLCITLADAIGRVQKRLGVRINKLDDLGLACFGRTGQIVARIVINGMFIGKIGCYMVLIGQNFAYLRFPPAYRGWVIIVTGFLLPMAFLRDVTVLEKLAFIGVLASAVYFITIVGGSIQASSKGMGKGAHLLLPAEFRPASMFSVLTVMMFGFGPTDVLATVRREMRVPEDLPKAITIAHVPVAVIYLSAGVLGFIGFGASVQGNIARSMCSFPGCPGVVRDFLWAHEDCNRLGGTWNAGSSKCTFELVDHSKPPGLPWEAGPKWVNGYLLAVAVVANLAVTIPIVLYCLFTGVEATYPKDEPMPAVLNKAMRIAVVVFCAAVGLFVPFFLEVVSIISAVLVVPTVFFLPLAFGYKSALDSGEPYSVPRLILDGCLFMLGIACLGVGLADALSDLVSAMENDPSASDPFGKCWWCFGDR